MKDEYVSLEHFILASLEDTQGKAARNLSQAGITREALMNALMDIRGGQRITDQNPEDKYQALERFSRDLTAIASKGDLDPVIDLDPDRLEPDAGRHLGQPGRVAVDRHSPQQPGPTVGFGENIVVGGTVADLYLPITVAPSPDTDAIYSVSLTEIAELRNDADILDVYFAPAWSATTRDCRTSIRRSSSPTTRDG